MRKLPLFTCTLGVIIGVILGTAATVFSQSRASSLADLTQEKQALTKMQWVLLNAMVLAIGEAPQSAPLMESSRFVTASNFMYDENTKKIVAVAFVEPRWLSQASVQEATKVLTMRTVDFCGVAVRGALADVGSPAALKWQNNCSVHFVTWDTDHPSKELSSKDVAFFNNGKLEFK